MERVLTHVALSYELGSVMPHPDVMEISAEEFVRKIPGPRFNGPNCGQYFMRHGFGECVTVFSQQVVSKNKSMRRLVAIIVTPIAH